MNTHPVPACPRRPVLVSTGADPGNSLPAPMGLQGCSAEGPHGWFSPSWVLFPEARRGAVPGARDTTVPAGWLCFGGTQRRGGTPSSYQEFLLQLFGAGRLVLQGPAGEGVSSRAQKVQGDLPGRVHRANGLHGPQGPHIQHQSHVGAPPAGTTTPLAAAFCCCWFRARLRRLLLVFPWAEARWVRGLRPRRVPSFRHLDAPAARLRPSCHTQSADEPRPNTALLQGWGAAQGGGKLYPDPSVHANDMQMSTSGLLSRLEPWALGLGAVGAGGGHCAGSQGWDAPRPPGKASPLLQPHVLLGRSFAGWRLGHGSPQRPGRRPCSRAPPPVLDHAGLGAGPGEAHAAMRFTWKTGPSAADPGLSARLRGAQAQARRLLSGTSALRCRPFSAQSCRFHARRPGSLRGGTQGGGAAGVGGGTRQVWSLCGEARSGRAPGGGGGGAEAARGGSTGGLRGPR